MENDLQRSYMCECRTGASDEDCIIPHEWDEEFESLFGNALLKMSNRVILKEHHLGEKILETSEHFYVIKVEQ